MGYTKEVLEDVLQQLHPGDEVIGTARERRNEVLDTMAAFPGHLRGYASGSIAHRTANFDTDADCGAVLDRRSYPDLGPDGRGEGPKEIVEEARAFLRERLKPDHPDIKFRVTKRAIQVTYHEPLPDGKDPQVDLIVALTRKEAQGLWIPNTLADRWDPSHPECHTSLLTADPKTLRQKRARVIRLAKGENGEHDEKGLCSFNLEALALLYVEDGTGLAVALAEFFENGAADLERRLTPDPAEVSPPIKTLLPREAAAKRLRRAGELVREALDNDEHECLVRAALSQVFPSYVEDCESSEEEIKEVLKGGGGGFTTAGVVASAGSTQQRQRSTRAYGDGTDDSG
ncbi:MAG: hypothetical protein F4Z77_13055 [Dehalococcoidia bacterium]|nr:hypothetical protein [Dehalococcoidia bacterium]MYA52666.1 hypothetical protein [Dehalococcoidia bacterium]